jgi:hypothetical protein
MNSNFLLNEKAQVACPISLKRKGIHRKKPAFEKALSVSIFLPQSTELERY